MTKFLSVCVFAICIFSANFCSANRYDDDPDYMFVTAAQGSIYLHLPSVDVQEYNPPHYQIAGHFIHLLNGSEDNISDFFRTYRYNWDTKEIFSMDEYGNFKKSDIKNGNTQSSLRSRKICDSLFRAAYGIDFYGY